MILLFIIYGVTGATSLIATLYILLPIVALGAAFIVWHSLWIIQVVCAYILLVLAVFTVNMGQSVAAWMHHSGSQVLP